MFKVVVFNTIEVKMPFKLGNRNRRPTHAGGYNIVRTPMLDGSIAEARNDGTIAIDPKVKPGSALDKRVIKHESKHMRDMDEGRAAYGDGWMMWDDKIYLRREINGEKVIDGPNGRWPEGDHNHPWEQEAVAAEKE